MNQDQNIPEVLKRQLSEAGKKGIAKMTNEQRAKGGRHSQKKVPHDERVRRGKLAWQARLERARALAAEMGDTVAEAKSA